MSFPVYSSAKPHNATIRKIWETLHPEERAGPSPPPAPPPNRSGSSSSATSFHNTPYPTALSARKTHSSGRRGSETSGSRSAPTMHVDPPAPRAAAAAKQEPVRQQPAAADRLPAIHTNRLAPSASKQQQQPRASQQQLGPMPQIHQRSQQTHHQTHATQSSGSFSTTATSSPPPPPATNSTTTSFELLNRQNPPPPPARGGPYSNNNNNNHQHNEEGGGRPVYVVVCLPGIGGVFDGIQSYLLRHRRNWIDGNSLSSTFTSNSTTTTMASAGKKKHHSSSSSSSSTGSRPPPCCNKLSRVSLFMGDKKTTEQLSEDARLLAMRARRQSSSMAPSVNLNCKHGKRASLTNLPLPSSPHSLLNFIEGLKAITLKSRMVKTLLSYHRNSWKELGTYLPKAYQLIPTGPGGAIQDEREQMVEAICEANVEVFEACREIASYWVAKSSHGSHGDNIRIFFGDQEGLDKLVQFIDHQKDPYAWVVSRYIDRPLLYNKRKFDIRVWVLVLPSFEVFIYRQLVMRMSSEKYDRSNCTTDNAKGLLSNITNHCVQAEAAGYGKHEKGNELWRDSLDTLVQQHAKQLVQRRQKKQMQQQASSSSSSKEMNRTDSGIVLSPNAQSGLSFGTLPTLDNCIMPQIRKIIAHSFRAVKPHVPDTSYGGSVALNFQMLGFDFIIDERLNVWLLEINGSPGVAEALMEQICEDTVELVLDQLFPDQGATRVRSGENEYEKLGNF